MQKQCAPEIEKLRDLRRYFHRNPELGFEEHRTQAFILKFFEGEITVKAGTGVFVYFDFGKKETIGFRSELDALPIQENSVESYRSAARGKMHACGHDGHMAILMILGDYIRKHRAEMKRNVLLIFQPGEELYGGAKSMINHDFFLRHRPCRIFALHLYPGLKVGEVFTRSGPFLAMCCEVDIAIEGKAAHAAHAEEGKDALRSANDLISGLYELFSDRRESCFLIGKAGGGTARNVVCDEFKIYMTIRNFDRRNYLKQKEEIFLLAKKTEHRYGTRIDMIFRDEFLPVVNSEKLFERIKENFPVHEAERQWIGDDFSEYQTVAETSYALLGVEAPPLHSSTFDFDETVLYQGYRYFITLLKMD